ncbi:PAS domain-containing protein [Ulvibacter litoralis]|uniref:histidine kinase n=1 Tax=Ulvibacter litoralis TaxID=227084 RepID=A0A1G7CAA2_9FLAO|nr:PAS domain S-box protein [Ulvibacter litoralis]GHC48252.1 hypothetical protein GCM10008083_09450 [Ulvibacter litoralis]SDE35636.1 PAS domain S-box-containing protein [Ulvibacter litoralis]
MNLNPKSKPIITSPLTLLKEQLFAFAKEDSNVFNFIFNQGNKGLLFFDIKNPTLKHINEVCIKRLGYSPASFSEKEASGLLSKTEEKVFLESLKKKPNTPENYTGELLFLNREKKKIIMTYEGFFCKDKGNNSTYFLCKITKKNISKTNYKNIIEGAEIATWEANLDTREVIFNENWAAILGYSYSELFPLTIDRVRSFMHPKDLENSQKILMTHLEGNTPFYEFESRMKHKSGKWIWVFLKSKVVIYTPEGNPQWMAGYIEDITSKKNAYDIQNTFIAQAPRAMAMFDNNMVHIAASEKWVSDFALNKEVIGKTIYEVFPEIADSWVELHQKCLGGVSESGDDEIFKREDGNIFWITWDVRPWYTNDNIVGGLIIYLTDVTKRKNAEDKLVISEATFRESFYSSATGMLFVSQEGRCLKSNNAVSDILGYSAKELTSINFRDITHPDDLEIDVSFFNELVANKRSFYRISKRYIHKEGHIVWVLMSVAKIDDHKGKTIYYITQLTDITEQKKAQLEVYKTSSYLQSLMDASTHVIIFARNMEGYLTVFNKGAENLLGYNKEDVILKETTDLFHHPFKDSTCSNVTEEEDIRIQKEFLYFMEKEGHYTNESTFTRKDGKQFPVLLTVTFIKDSEGEKMGFLGIATDITDLKAIDKKMKSLLSITQEQNEKLKNFAQIVSHNLRSHYGNSEMLLELFQDEHPSLINDSTFNFIKETSEKLNQTISLLNDVVVINSTPIKKLDTVDVQKLLNIVLFNTKSMAKNANVTIESYIDKPLFVLGINAYIESIIQNIISNAIKYFSAERDSFLKIRHRKDDKFIILSFEDNGLGLDLKKHGNKIFGMYKTFHKHEDAKGIGLFLSRQQVEVMGGRIEVESTVDKGSIFKVYLPYE